MKLPDFIIVGTMKSGTSTLAHYLNQYQSIYMPEKEIHFFDNLGGYKDRWGKGIEWYASQFKDAKDQQLIGEKTPTYSYLKDVPERIHEVLPNVKLIWIFRHPIDRAYSNYWHAVKNGSEKESFEYAVIQEKERLKDNIFQGYIERSKYSDQVKNYLEYFPADNMCFLTLKNLKEDLPGAIQRIGHFLQIEFDPLTKFEHEIKNKTYLPRFKNVRYLTSTLFGSRSFVSKVERKINRTSKKYQKMDVTLRMKLIHEFREHNDELSEITGLNLAHWDY